MPLRKGSDDQLKFAFLLKDIKATDKAYAAGLIDGEGSISAVASPKCPTNFKVTVAVAMCSSEPIQWLASCFGGKVAIRSTPTKSGKAVFSWTIYCQRAADFLTLVLPYLKVKRGRARNAIVLARLMKLRPVANKVVFTVEEVEQRRLLAGKIREENLAGNGRVVRYATKTR